MPGIFRFGSINGIFSDVYSVVTDALEAARYPRQIHIALNLVGRVRDPPNNFVVECSFRRVHFGVAFPESPGQIGVLFAIRTKAVVEQSAGLIENRTQQDDVAEAGFHIQFSGPSRNRDGLVAHSLQVAAHLHCGIDPAQIGSNRLEMKQDADTGAIDINLELVDLSIIGDSRGTGSIITFKKSTLRVTDVSYGHSAMVSTCVRRPASASSKELKVCFDFSAFMTPFQTAEKRASF